VKLPEPICTALLKRNGGFVRGAPIHIAALEEIMPVDDDYWLHTEITDDQAPDHDLLYTFGYETEVGGTFLMNFNTRGPTNDPSVYLDMHGESTYLLSDSVRGYFEAALATAGGPSVHWEETESHPDVIARDTIDCSALHDGEPAALEQVLARQGEALILYVQERSPGSETLTRTTLPLPLDPDWAQVRPRRRAPVATFGLHLQPAENAGIVYARSERSGDAGWKNSTAEGSPIYAMFESTDRARLESLRTQLLGTKAAAHAQEIHDRQTAFQDLLATLTPEQRTAALMQEAMKLKAETDRRFAAQFGDLGSAPPDVAQAAENLRRTFEQMAEQARKKAAANPLDPEVLRKIQEHLRDPDAQ
jgi:hypothetical protein